jgi:hypothetical protein
VHRIEADAARIGTARRSDMHTRRTILLIVATLVVAALGGAAVLVAWLGWAVAAAVVVVAIAAAAVTYRLVVQPWHHRYGATAAEVAAAMEGDDLLGPAAPSTTRAITIGAPPERVWPWLVQLGFGRAGWYSYDWVDNDGRPSATTILPEHQHLAVGDLIAMMPGVGFEVRSLAPARSIVSQAPDGMTWSLGLTPVGPARTRLVSRFRAAPSHGLGPRLWMLLADPGAFVMERRMLAGIKARVEAAAGAPGYRAAAEERDGVATAGSVGVPGGRAARRG